MGFKEESLTTNTSEELYKQWKNKNCQPNYRQHVTPNPRLSCGPYTPEHSEKLWQYERKHHQVSLIVCSVIVCPN